MVSRPNRNTLLIQINFAKKFVEALFVRRAVLQVSSFVKETLRAGKVSIPEDGDEPEFAQHR